MLQDSFSSGISVRWFASFIPFQNYFLPFIYYVILKSRTVYYIKLPLLFLLLSSVMCALIVAFSTACIVHRRWVHLWLFFPMRCELHEGRERALPFWTPPTPPPTSPVAPSNSLQFLIKHNSDFTLCSSVLFIQFLTHPAPSIFQVEFEGLLSLSDFVLRINLI